jgi:hypothetical protein
VAKTVRQKGKIRKTLRDDVLPLSRDNYIILGIGIVTISLGYVAMLENSVEGFLPLVAAPILLVVGYCFLIPFGIMYRKRQPKAEEVAPGVSPHQG